MYDDPDGLNLKLRYPLAKHRLLDPYGKPYTAENPLQGMYIWSDQDVE